MKVDVAKPRSKEIMVLGGRRRKDVTCVPPRTAVSAYREALVPKSPRIGSLLDMKV